MTAHWIEVKDEKWSLHSEVVSFKAVSGDHSGWNLGWYFVGMCDRVGICSQEGSKVCNQALFGNLVPHLNASSALAKRQIYLACLNVLKLYLIYLAKFQSVC
jgi:hypothetical protein